MDSPAVEQRIKDLAKTLRSTGIAASQTRAEEMARDIVRTEVRQQQMLDKKREDPSLNPQQRISTSTQNVSYSVGGSPDKQKPIGELLSEPTREDSSVVKRPESFSVEQFSSQPEQPQQIHKQQSEHHLVRKTEELFNEPEVEVVSFDEPLSKPQDVAPAISPERHTPQPFVEPPKPVMQYQPAPATSASQAPTQPRSAMPAQPLSGANSAQKAFGLLLSSATQQQKATEQHAQQPPAHPQQTPQSSAITQSDAKPDKEKSQSAQNKVDLSEMFNFSKRK